MYSRLSACCLVQVVQDVLALNGIARHLKSGRADNGALRLDNTKLYFKMDEHGNPVSAGPYGMHAAASEQMFMHELACCCLVLAATAGKGH